METDQETMSQDIIDPYEFHDTDSDEEDTTEEIGPLYFKKRKDIDENNCATSKGKTNIIPLDILRITFCCSLFCLTNIGVEDLSLARFHFQERTKHERSQWIIDWIITTSGNSSKEEKTFMIGHKKVCFKAWRLTNGIAESTFYKLQSEVLNGRTLAAVIGRLPGSAEPKTLSASAWLQSFANSYAGFMPDSKQLHLPCCLTKSGVFDAMIKEVEGPHISLSHFLYIWRTELHHIAIPKRSRFSECNICVKIKIALESTRDKLIKKQLLEQRNIHLKQQKAEREKYYKHTIKAKNSPDKYLSIIVDAMDQSKTMLPHFTRKPKACEGLWLLKTHLLAAIVHGVGVYGFFDLFQWPHGSNLTISVLLSLFQMLKDSLPETLYLQMDNCGRENKNRFVMAFLALLVEKKVFKKIKLSFLMVGHTHEDIDQMFSRFSMWLNRHNCHTYDKLLAGFESSYTPNPTGITTTEVYNFSEWISPYIAPMSGHSKPHVFKFVLENDRCKMMFKEWSTSKEWKKCEGSEEYPILSRPTQQPMCTPPIFNDLEKVEESINKAKSFMTDEEYRFWKNYLEEKRTEEINYEDKNWCLDELSRHVTMARAARIRCPSIPAPIIVQCDRVMPPVILGKKTKTCQSSTSNKTSMKIGDMVLTDLDKYADEWPQLGKVHSLSGEIVTVHWYKGSKTSSWSPCTIPIKGQRGKRSAFLEDVDKSQIWKFGFSLTNNNCLSKTTREEIDCYNLYIEQFPGLVHFVYIDRRTNQVTAPSFNITSGEITPELGGTANKEMDATKLLKDKVWKMMEFMQLKLKNGIMCVAVREGDFYFSYFLWFGDSLGNILQPQQNLHLSVPLASPGVLSSNFYNSLLRRCFPNVVPGSVACFELMMMHVGLVSLSYISENRSRLSAVLRSSAGDSVPPMGLTL